MSRFNPSYFIANNARWTDMRHRLLTPPRSFPDEVVEMLDLCRASRQLRRLHPYISLGRLGLWRHDLNEKGYPDEFACLCYYADNYIVSSYDNEKKYFFNTAAAAVDFVEQHVRDEHLFCMNTPLVLLGAGAREHALAWKLRQDGATVHVLPGNAAIPGSVPGIGATDFATIKGFCEAHGVKLIVVGPEAPLAAGVADYFLDTDIRVFGPRRQGATLESSKVWSKDFMRRHGVATARAWSYRSDRLAEAQAKAEELHGQVVVKYDGLAAGKGVYVCSSVAEATAALAELRALHEGWFSVLLEEKLTGPEVSLIGVTDGNRIRLLSPAQDHKQLLAGDEGPNTGGMGAYCPVSFLDDNWLAAIRRDIIDPTLRGLQAEPFDFMGFLYFGVMLTPAGPRLLEYNVRLGDPEAEVILPALESSLLDLITATLDGSLAQTVVRQRPGAFVGVVLASGGYPAAQFATGFPIHGIGRQNGGAQVFAGGVKAGEQPDELLTAGGRVAVVVTHGPDLPTAVQLAYAEAELVTFQHKYVRPDIGQRPAPLLETGAY